jgi:hypothetical protein
MTRMVGVDKCVAVDGCGVVVDILQRVIIGKIREGADSSEEG